MDKEQDEDQTGEEESQLLNSHMKSGVFLLLYTVSNALLLTSCSIYLAATRDLGEKEDNALVLPQILALVPGKIRLMMNLRVIHTYLLSGLRPLNWSAGSQIHI